MQHVSLPRVLQSVVTGPILPGLLPCRVVPEIQFSAFSVFAQQKGLITAAQALVLQQVRE